MTHEQRQKLINLRIKSKMGGQLTSEEMAFCQEMHKKYPDQYPKDEEIFKITEKMVNPLAGEVNG